MDTMSLEKKLLQSGLCRLDKCGETDVVLGRRLSFRQVRGILRARLLRLGAQTHEDLSIVYSRENSLISLHLLKTGQTIEFEGSQIAHVMWHLGFDSEDPGEAEGTPTQ